MTITAHQQAVVDAVRENARTHTDGGVEMKIRHYEEIPEKTEMARLILEALRAEAALRRQLRVAAN